MASLTGWIDRDTEKRFVTIIPLALWLAVETHRKKHKLDAEELWEEIIRRGWQQLQADAHRRSVLTIVRD